MMMTVKLHGGFAGHVCIRLIHIFYVEDFAARCFDAINHGRLRSIRC